MRVVVPFAASEEWSRRGIWPATLASLGAHCPVAPMFVDVSGDETMYFELLAGLWDGSDDLVLIEQDIIVHADVFPQFERCLWPWCVFPYYKGPQLLTRSFGCAKFSKRIQQDFPDLFDRVAEHGTGARVEDGMAPKVWFRLDARTAHELEAEDIFAHAHEPHVGHRGVWRMPLDEVAAIGGRV